MRGEKDREIEGKLSGRHRSMTTAEGSGRASPIKWLSKQNLICGYTSANCDHTERLLATEPWSSPPSISRQAQKKNRSFM